MSRSLLRYTVTDADGNAIQNAKVYVYLAGTTTAVNDLYVGATGGVAVTTLLSTARGEVIGWVVLPKLVDLLITDNGSTAFYPSTPARLLTWTALTETVEVGAVAEMERATAVEATKANDSAVVHTTGDETKAGVLTFSSPPVVPANSFPESAIAGLVANRNAAIATAVANLVASSPTTLDTLNELATALGDDPNFATTVTNALAARALAVDLTAEIATARAAESTRPTFAQVRRTRSALGPNLGANMRVPFRTDTNNGALTSRRVVTFPFGIYGMRVVFANWFVSSSTPREQAGPSTLTIAASVEATGIASPPFSFGGKRLATLEPWGLLISEPLGSDAAVGGTAAFRSYLSVPVPGTDAYITNYLPDSTALNGEGWTAGDVTIGTAAMVNISAANYLFTPVAILGENSSGVPSLLVLGDSIPSGMGDSKGLGWIVRGVNAALPMVRASVGSELQSTFNTTPHRRMAVGEGARLAVSAYGRNDLNSAHTAAAIEADWLTGWNKAANRGMKTWQSTITPQTTSTDGWLTTGAQTVASSSNELVRLAINAWLRGGAPIDPTSLAAVAVGTAGALVAGQDRHPLAGIIEATDAIESARDSGLFKAADNVGGGIVSASLTANVVTITTAAAHGVANTQSVVISGVGAPYDGVYVVTGVPSTTTLTYAKVAANQSVGAGGNLFLPYTADGLHPQNNGHIAMGATIPLSTMIATALNLT